MAVSTHIGVWLDKYGVSLDWEAKAELKRAIEQEFENLLIATKTLCKIVIEDSFVEKNEE